MSVWQISKKFGQVYGGGDGDSDCGDGGIDGGDGCNNGVWWLVTAGGVCKVNYHIKPNYVCY